MKGKTVLVTGSNSGIGYEAAKDLAGKGASLILHARTQAKADDAKKRILQKHPTAQIETVTADFESLQDVRKMAEQLLQKGQPIDVLLNNAGLFSKERAETQDGFEKTFGVNHLAPFLLTNLLMPLIKAAPEPRIVNVASNAHHRSGINWDDLQHAKKYSSIDAYCQSKLANILFTKQLAVKIAAGDFDGNNPASVRKIKTNSLHPGAVNTNISSGAPGFFGLIWKVMGPFMYTSEKGAKTSVYLASSAEETTTGEYFVKSKVAKSSAASHDMDSAKRLWDLSVEMTNLK